MRKRLCSRSFAYVNHMWGVHCAAIQGSGSEACAPRCVLTGADALRRDLVRRLTELRHVAARVAGCGKVVGSAHEQLDRAGFLRRMGRRSCNF